MARPGFVSSLTLTRAYKLCMFIPWGLIKSRHRERNSLYLFCTAGRGRTDLSSSVFLLHNGIAISKSPTHLGISLRSQEKSITSYALPAFIGPSQPSPVRLRLLCQFQLPQGAPAIFSFLPRAALAECCPRLSWPYGSHHRVADGLPGKC